MMCERLSGKSSLHRGVKRQPLLWSGTGHTSSCSGHCRHPAASPSAVLDASHRARSGGVQTTKSLWEQGETHHPDVFAPFLEVGVVIERGLKFAPRVDLGTIFTVVRSSIQAPPPLNPP